MPQRLDLFNLGEETMAANIKPPTVALNGSADSADDVICFENHGRVAGLA